MRRLTEKEAEDILNEMKIDFTEEIDELTVEIENLRHNIYLFQKYISKVKEFSEDHKELFEAKTKQNAVNELKEPYYSIQDVDKRIQSNIRRIKELLDKKPQLSQAFAKDTNQSFLDT